MNSKGLIGGIALALLALTAPASAYTISIVDIDPRGAAFDGDPFSLLNLGSSAPNAGLVSTTGATVDGITYSFSGGASATSGIYAGGTGNAASPYGDLNTTTNYFSAGGGGGQVRLDYASAQTSLWMLWGTVDGGQTRNRIETSAGEAISGSQILSLAGCATCSDGNTEVWLQITGLQSFDYLLFNDANGNAFEFNVASAVPEPATWGMMILGFAGVGFMAYRRSRKDQGLALTVA